MSSFNVHVLCIVMASTIFSYRGHQVNGNNSCSFPECKLNVDGKSTSGFSTSEKSPLHKTEKNIHIENNDNCSINTTSLYGLVNLNTDQGLISFECVSDIWVQFYSDNALSNKYAFSTIKFSICRITLDSYYALKKNIGNISALALEDTAISVQKTSCDNIDSSKDICGVLASMASVSLKKSTSKYAQFNLSFLFSCPESYTSVKALGIHGIPMDLRTISILEKKFPFLQSLEISNSNITIPPRFPWSKAENVSSTRNNLKDLRGAHANREIIAFEKRFTRALNLKSNNIYDLRNFAFEGTLKTLDLSCNGLQQINDITFNGIIGLERLNLRNNSLNTISNNLFKHLQNLEYLDLSSNSLKEISKEIFSDVKKLKYLDLSYNNIKTVEETAFGELSYLEEINLRSNEIKHLPNNLFMAASMKLKNIFADFNPLENIPFSIFYIRTLEKASFRNTNIDLRDINDMLYRMDWYSILNSVIVSSPGIIDKVFLSTSEKLRIIDLSGSKIENFPLAPLESYEDSGSIVKMKNDRIVVQKNFLLLVKYFEFILDGIEFACDCRINEFNRIINQAKSRGEFSGTEYIFQKLKCSTPIEMKNELVVNIKESDTYCEKVVPHCPYNCTCFERHISRAIIVDCRNRGYFFLPKRLPNGILDIWFQHNNVSVLVDVEYLNRTRYLSLSSNKIEEIKVQALIQMTNLRHLYLNSNNLVTLPRELQKSNIEFIDINHNPFKCDCNSLWMKHWIIDRSKYILSIADVTCNVDDESEKGTKFINIPDVDFVCIEDFDSIKDGIIPTTASTLAVLLSVLGICLLYVFRFEAKVLTFLYLGIHPFDLDEDDGREPVDALILHVPGLTQWVVDNIVTYLEKQKCQYVVCEFMRDFIPGFSFQENISCIVKNSKRLILVVSPELLEGQMLKLIWNEAQEQIKTLRHNYVITVLYHVKIGAIANKEMVRFVKNSNVIKWNDRLFCQKLLYCMPVYKGFSDIDGNDKKLPNIQNCVMNMYGDITLRQEVYDRHVFISYSETEIHCMLNDIKPILDETGYSLWLPDRDFIPGASKEENILKAIDSSLHTLFFVSENHLLDEWSVFTFRTAFEKSLRSKSNHLIVILSENVDIDELDEEIKNLVTTHVILQIGEEWFVQKLLNSLSDAKPCIQCIVDETQLREGFYFENDAQSVTDSMLFDSTDGSDADANSDNEVMVNNIHENNEDEEEQELDMNARINIVVENNFEVANEDTSCSINMSENESIQNARVDDSSLSEEENSEIDMSSDNDESEENHRMNQSGICLNINEETLQCGNALQMNIKDSMCLNVKEEEENLWGIQNVNVGSRVRTCIPHYGTLDCDINCQHYQIPNPYNTANGDAISDSDNYTDSENDDKDM